MEFRCSECGVAFVDHEDDVCENCQLFHPVDLGDTGSGSTASQSHNKTVNSARKINVDDSTSKKQTLGRIHVRNILFENTEAQEDIKSMQEQDSNNEQQQAESVQIGKNNEIGINEFQGFIKGYKKEKDPEPGVVRFFNALFEFTPFSIYRDIHYFQLYHDWSSVNQSAKKAALQTKVSDGVILHGNIGYGHINENAKVKITGKRKKNGTIVARKIVNITTGEEIKVRQVIDPITLWTITLLIIGMIIWLFHSLFGGYGTLSWSEMGSILLVTVLAIIGMIIGMKFILGSRKMLSVILVGIIFIIAKIIPAIGMPILTLLLLVIILKFYIKMIFK